MQRGFSLLELSIVLVIIGLITGGIMAGRSMVRAAELRSVMSDLSKYQTATNTFREKYNGLPGDLKNATAYWGAADAGDGLGTDCMYVASASASTCNGDGNGTIHYSAGTYESGLFWKHLANAGLIEGQYTGAPNCAAIVLTVPNARCGAIGVNIPQSKITNVSYWMWNVGCVDSTNAVFFEGCYNNNILFGAMDPNDIPENPAFKPDEAMAIDVKMDDGKPGTGIIRPYENQTACSTTTVAATAEYALSYTGAACNLQYITGF